MSMQMDDYLKKEQIGTLFVWVGHWKGGLGGGVPQGCPPQKVIVSSKKNLLVSKLYLLYCASSIVRPTVCEVPNYENICKH